MSSNVVYAPEDRYEVKEGDFLMSRANTIELVGACAVVEHTRPRLLLSDKIFRFRFRPDVDVNLRWLNNVLKSPALRQQVVRGATGTSPTMKNISKEKVFALLVPPHSSLEQTALVSELSRIEAAGRTVASLQASSTAELNALLPSILDRAFRGEL